MASDSGTTRDEARVLLRYRYRDGTLQAAFPMRVVQDDDTLVVVAVQRHADHVLGTPER